MDTPDAVKKTPGQLIDELMIVNMKIWWNMENETDSSLTEHQRFEAGQNVITLNKKRSKLIEAINYYFGVTDFNPKTY